MDYKEVKSSIRLLLIGLILMFTPFIKGCYQYDIGFPIPYKVNSIGINLTFLGSNSFFVMYDILIIIIVSLIILKMCSYDKIRICFRACLIGFVIFWIPLLQINKLQNAKEFIKMVFIIIPTMIISIPFGIIVKLISNVKADEIGTIILTRLWFVIFIALLSNIKLTGFLRSGDSGNVIGKIKEKIINKK